jgi:uncharacterized protein YecT (DUF1311 family)
MSFLIFSARPLFVVFVLLVSLSETAISQDQNSLARRCFSITDVNERIDCLEAGGASSEAVPPPGANAARQPRVNPSFDCRAARGSIARAICGDATLSEWDFRMGQAFQQSLRLAKDRQAFLEGQRLWLVQRDSSCGSVADSAVWSCLLEMTKSRAAALEKAAATLVEVAPTVQASPTPAVPAMPQSRTQSALNEPTNNRSPTPPPAAQNVPSTSVSSGDKSSGVGDTGSGSLLLLIVFGFGLVIALSMFSAIRRKRHLIAKYGHEIAAKIIAHQVWQGMTEEQLTDSWGSPVDVGREIIRTKVKETWKYGQTGKNRFRNRVYLENGIVIGWKN